MVSQEQLSRLQTLEQQRAADAWQNIESVSEGIASKYGSIVRRFPSLVQINGLGQTLAFLKSKNDQGMSALYDHISKWVIKRMVDAEGEDLLKLITGWTSDEYRRATSEALAYATWLRRFAEAKGMTNNAEND